MFAAVRKAPEGREEVLLSDSICSPNKRLIVSAGIDFGLPV